MKLSLSIKLALLLLPTLALGEQTESVQIGTKTHKVQNALIDFTISHIILRTTAQIGATQVLYISDREIADGGDGIDGYGTSSTDARNGGTYAKLVAILNTLTANAEIHLGKGTYQIDASYCGASYVQNWLFKSGWTFKGAGMYQTTLQIRSSSSSGGELSAISANPGDAHGSDNVELSDLAIDCNVQSNGATNTRAISLGGDNIYIHDVFVTNYGRSTAGECFVVAASGNNCHFRRIVFGTEVFSNGAYADRLSAGNGSITTMQPDDYSGWARNIEIEGCAFGGVPDGGINVQINGANGARIHDNYFFGGGQMFYVDTCPNRNVQVYNNNAININTGCALVGAGAIIGFHFYGNVVLHSNSTGEQDGIKIESTASILNIHDNYFGYYSPSPTNAYSTFGINLSGTTNDSIVDNIIDTGAAGGGQGIQPGSSTTTWNIWNNHQSNGAIATGLNGFGTHGGVIGTARFSSSTGSIAGLYNDGIISAVTRTGAGTYHVTFAAAQSDSNYMASFTVDDSGGGSSVNSCELSSADPPVTSGFGFYCSDVANRQLFDGNNIHVTVMRLSQ